MHFRTLRSYAQRNLARREKAGNKVGIDVSGVGWNTQIICSPYVFDHAGPRDLLYDGNDYGMTGFGLAMLE